MNTIKGPPSLWITIDPLEIGDPIAQVFVGEQINLDNFDKTMGPNSPARNLNMAGDPYVATKFFHYVIATLLEKLFGIKAHNKQSHVKRASGVFGKVTSYIGTVEAQG